MKTFEQQENFIKEIKLLCEKYGIGMVGTCSNEGIYGEISLFDIEYPELSSGWSNIEKHAFNFEEFLPYELVKEKYDEL